MRPGAFILENLTAWFYTNIWSSTEKNDQTRHRSGRKSGQSPVKEQSHPRSGLNMP